MNTKTLLLAGVIVGGVYLYSRGMIPGLSPTAGSSQAGGVKINPPRVIINRYPCSWRERLNDPNWKFPAATWKPGQKVYFPGEGVLF